METKLKISWIWVHAYFVPRDSNVGESFQTEILTYGRLNKPLPKGVGSLNLGIIDRINLKNIWFLNLDMIVVKIVLFIFDFSQI